MTEGFAEIGKSLAEKPAFIVVLVLAVLIVPTGIQAYVQIYSFDQFTSILASNIKQGNSIMMRQNEIITKFQEQQNVRSDLLRELIQIEARTARAMEFCYGTRIPQGVGP